MKKNLLLAAVAALTLSTTVSAASLPQASNAQSFINNYQTRVRLQKLLGNSSYNIVRNSFQVTSTLQNDSDIMAFSGCKRNSCADTQSIVIYDRMNDVLEVYYHYAEKVLQVKENDNLDENNFGVDLQDAIDNQLNN